MKLHDAIVKFPPKEWAGEYGQYLGCKVTLDTGYDVNIYEKNVDNKIFLSLKKGQRLKVAESAGKNGKTKYTACFDATHTCTNVEPSMAIDPTTTGQPASSKAQLTRLDQLLDCFQICLEKVENRWPQRDPDDQRAIATTMLIQLQKEYGQALRIDRQPVTPPPEPDQAQAIANEPAAIGVDDPDPNNPWKQWKSPNDAIVWAQGELPDWDIDDIQEAFQSLPDQNGKKAKAWCEWVSRRKEIFGKENWF